MSDHHHHSPISRQRPAVSAEPRRAAHAPSSTCGPISGRPTARDLKLRVLGAMVLLLAAKLATVAVPFTFKWATDALAGHGSAPVAASEWLVWALAAPVAMTIAYGGMRILMAALTQTARRAVRQGGDARGAPARLPHLRAHARAVAALPSRAQDRRAHPRARARPQRHRDHRAHGDPAALAHHHRAGADRRRADVEIRLALRAGDPDHRRRLYDLHLSRHRVAHRHPPQDERERHRRQRQGDRLAAQLRDGEIFQRRAARGRALRQVDGALRRGQHSGPIPRLPCSMPGRR